MKTIPVIDEVHYMSAGETIRLEHDNIVKLSFVSNMPVKIDWDKATITALFDSQEKLEVVCSYLYNNAL